MKRKVILLLFIILFNNYFCFIYPNNAYSIDDKKDNMFSVRLSDNTGDLLVVKNTEGFIRKVVGSRFEYEKISDGCYAVEQDREICFQDENLSSTEGGFHNVANENKIKNVRYIDDFFNEKNTICNKMKFDIINKLMVKKEEIDGFVAQIYLLDYFSLIRLFLYRDDENSKTKAFIISDKNDVGCSPFYDYKLYENDNEDYSNNKKNNKKKKIIAKNQKDYIKQVAVESYKPMLLKDYTYIQPANEIDDAQKIVLSIINNEVTYIHPMLLGFKWRKIGYYDVFSAESDDASDDKEDGKKKPKKPQVINTKKN